MVLHFNVTGASRKAMVQAIEKEIGGKAKYLGVPSCAYEIGGYRVEKDGTLSWADLDDADPQHLDQNAKVVDACVMATGVSPAEWDFYEEQLKAIEEHEKGAETAETEPEKGAEEYDSLDLTVGIPLEKVAEGNLKNLLEAKGDLIKKALGIENLNFLVDEEKVEFPWFTNIKPEEAVTYTKFIAALCEMSIKQKRITAKAKENENEKYAFRCFLLRLGFIGDDYKADRKILLSKLEGSSAFKSGEKKGGEQ